MQLVHWMYLEHPRTLRVQGAFDEGHDGGRIRMLVFMVLELNVDCQ